MLEYKNIQQCLQKAIFLIAKRGFCDWKVKNVVLWTYVINDWNGKKNLERFTKKNTKKANQKEFRVEKVIKRKCDKLHVKWESCDNSLNSSIDKIEIVWMSEYFPKQKCLRGNVKVELDLSNYGTKKI